MRSETRALAAGIEFPCNYPIKAMGPTGTAFEQLVRRIVANHAGRIDDGQVRVKASSGGKFQSVTLTVRIESRDQLESLYQELAATETVLWTL